MFQSILAMLFPKLVWRKINESKNIFLTFDDGPIPEITPWVLDTLEQYEIKATFFCIGDNIRKYPEIFEQIIAKGHRIGNHTYNHLDGFTTDTNKYIENTIATSELIQKHLQKTLPLLFRPPYGKITSKQRKKLNKLGYQIIMWTNLTKDYNHKISSEKCLKNALNKLGNGNIIVFHDSVKAYKNLKNTLPKFIKQAKKEGHSFDVL